MPRESLDAPEDLPKESGCQLVSGTRLIRGLQDPDGSTKTADVVAFCNKGGVKNPWLSSDVRPLGSPPKSRAGMKQQCPFLRSPARS